MEGKLVGAMVLRADASDAHSGNYGVIHSLAEGLFEAAPELAAKVTKPFVHVLGHVLPELLERFEEVTLKPFNNPQTLRPSIQTELRRWLYDVSLNQCLVIAVDDVHRIDEPSAALLALLANEARSHRLVIAITVENNADARAHHALKLLSKAGLNVVLENLNANDSAKLVQSIFGQSPHWKSVADRLYTLSNGNPRTTMELAQHLVDKGIARYQGGTWRLPSTSDTADLPPTFTEALRERLHRLSPKARELAEVISLSPDQSFTLNECNALSGLQDAIHIQPLLDELVSVKILMKQAHRYALVQHAWVTALTQCLSETSKRSANLKLAALFERRGNDDFRLAQHLIHAGEQDRGLGVLAGFFHQVNRRFESSAGAFFEVIQTLPTDWVAFVESAINMCIKLGRPPIDSYVMRLGIVSLNTVDGSLDKDNIDRLFEQLVQDSGLAVYHQLDGSLDASTRLTRALEQTQRRYDESPPRERISAPAEAIQQLAHVVIQAASNYAWGFDYSRWKSLPSIEPLTPLSPALDIVAKIVSNIGNLIVGRNECFHQRCLEILRRIDETDHAGLDETLYRYTRLNIVFVVALIEASWGARSTLRWTDELDTDPLHHVNAWRVRTIYHLFQGDFEQADICRKQAELLTIQNSPPQFYDGSTLYTELLAYTTTDNLQGVRQLIKHIEKIAERFDGWKPLLFWAHGEYKRIRGELSDALVEHEKAIHDVVPGRHQGWGYIAAAHLKTLIELRRFREAKELGKKYLLECENAAIGYMLSYLKLQIALAEAMEGEYESATIRCETVIVDYKTLDVSGIFLGISYEFRARIALMMNDQHIFEKYALLCAEQYRSGRNPALTTRFQKLIDEARDAQLHITPILSQAAKYSEYNTLDVGRLVESILMACQHPHERVVMALEMLIKQSGATFGYLYTIQDKIPVLSAQHGDAPPPDGLDEIVRAYISSEIEDANEAMITGGDNDGCFEGAANWNEYCDGSCRPLLLSHYTEDGFAITGLAVLFRDTYPKISLNIPWKISTIVSKSLLNAGDATILLRRTS
jgi:hypothetical protein